MSSVFISKRISFVQYFSENQNISSLTNIANVEKIYAVSGDGVTYDVYDPLDPLSNLLVIQPNIGYIFVCNNFDPPFFLYETLGLYDDPQYFLIEKPTAIVEYRAETAPITSLPFVSYIKTITAIGDDGETYETYDPADAFSTLTLLETNRTYLIESNLYPYYFYDNRLGSEPIVPLAPTNGQLWLWGYNSYGQIGDNTITYKSSPVQTIAGGNNWNSLSAGDYHTGAIKDDGTLWIWGRNSYGELGNNTTTHTSSPIQTIAYGSLWRSVQTGNGFTAATQIDGTLWVWGKNSNGQLGNQSIQNISSPIQTTTGEKFPVALIT